MPVAPGRSLRQLQLPGRTVDLLARQVHRDGRPAARLTAQEARLLGRLAATPGEAVSRRELLVEVWGYHPESRSRAPDVAVHRLRSKLEEDPARPAFLCTVLGQGWVLRGAAAQREERRLPPELVGRQALADEVAAHLAAGAGPGVRVCLTGPPGVGKTALAAAVLAGQPGEWIVADLGGARDEEGLLLGVAQALRLPMGGVRDLGGHVARLLAQRRPLLWLDAPEAVAEPLARWLPAWEVGVLATSRVALPGLERLEVPPLDPDAAEVLFARLAPGLDSAAARRLLAGLDGLPLAIRLAAARARRHGLDAVLGAVGVRYERLEGAGEGSLAEGLARSWELLGEAERGLLVAVAPLAEAFDLATAEALAPPGPPWVDGLLDGLEAASLLVREPGPRHRLLEGVRWFVRQQGAGELDRLLAWVSGGRAGWATLQGVLDRVARERPEALTALVLHLEATQREALPLSARRALLSRGSGAEVRARLAQVAFLAGEHGALKALEAAHREAAGTPLGDRVLLDLARARRASRLPDAAQLAELGAALERAAAPALRVALLRELSEQHVDRREFDAARLALRQALAVQGAPDARPELLCGLGHLALEQQRPAEGIPAVEEALGLAPEGVLGERAWRTLGGLRFHAGDLDGAVLAWEHARALAAELGLWRQHAVSLGNLGAAWIELGQLDDARRVVEEALATSRELGQGLTEVPGWLNLGQVALLEGDTAEARRALGVALELAEAAGWAHLAVQARLGLAIADQLDGSDASEELRAVAAAAAASERERRLAAAHLAMEEGAPGLLDGLGASDRRLLTRVAETSRAAAR